MLSRLLTRREQLVLLAVAAGLIVGSLVLLTSRRPAEGELSIPEPPGAPAPEVEPAAMAAEKAPDDLVTTVVQPPAPAAAVPAPTAVKVAVRGAVVSPGLYEFDPDARIQEALDRAGGPTEAADLSDINAAARLLDGTTLTVPERPEAPEPGRRPRAWDAPPAFNPPGYTISGWRPEPVAPQADGTAATAVTGAGTAGVLDLNTASAAQLETLPGIGPKLAAQIVQYRENGRFTSVEDLENVTGIGPKRLEAIRPFITVQ